ncbi:MAG TPA: coproporphyrinogen III oxidase [Verrucomicrobia bacterium]|nr:MAG: hypothetical protein A2X46_08360 [Lentisphaerae bacterium GWF2_57_35]HBA83675.1 coproporphyrinogen III oxidase [Verrucomicrobiota bacterium]
MKTSPGLYIHVPFCVRKCHYCDFYSIPCATGDQTFFLDALDRELAALPDRFFPGTVYMGGGTPSSLSVDNLKRLLKLVGKAVDLYHVQEWSIEVNPGTLTPEKARLLIEAGVNRVSLGVQSFDPENLAFLGRIHTRDEAEAAYLMLREAGFANVGIDLIYGIPGSGHAKLAKDLARVIQLNPEHVSCYCLIFEEGTPLTELRDRDRISEVDDEEELDQYNLIRDALDCAGLRQYEISNFARVGRECRHNLLYWSGGEYIGCGPAAHSHWRGMRYGNVRSLESYCAAFKDKSSPREFEERLEPEAKARETLVMSLRRCDGVDRDFFKKDTGFDYRKLAGDQIDWLCSLELLEERDNRLRLTERGLFVSDSVFAELI